MRIQPQTYLIGLLLCSLSGLNALDSAPVAERGLIDLRNYNFKSSGPVELNGEFEFYWNQMLNPAVVGELHYRIAQRVRRALAEYEELKDIVSMLGLEELSYEDRDTIGKARRLERFLTQPFATTEQFTGQGGRYVPLALTIDGCEQILDGVFDDLPESALYMIGSTDEMGSTQAVA